MILYRIIFTDDYEKFTVGMYNCYHAMCADLQKNLEDFSALQLKVETYESNELGKFIHMNTQNSNNII